jgi:integrase
MGNRAGRAGAPNTVNSSVRTREYLTVREVERLIAAARKFSRYGHRDATMILIGFRHGLRASELCDLQWHQVELGAGRVHVRRAKSGSPSALRRLQREQGGSSHVFSSERQPHDSEGVPRPVRPDRRLGQDATCSGTPAAMPWRMQATIPVHYRRISATRTSSTRCATLS